MTMPESEAQIDRYLGGHLLYGDEFTEAQIEAWYRDEKEGYANLGARDRATYRYAYHELNRRHGFRWLPARRFAHALGFGSAYADEFEPIADRVDRLTVVDPSDAFAQDSRFGVPITYVQPTITGQLPLPNASISLVTCLGVLHHIPNISFVVTELARCLEPSGYALIREPIVSMGDWRRPRPGLTSHERGIPLLILREIVGRAGLRIRKETLCVFPGTGAVARLLGRTTFASPSLTALDQALCNLLRWNVRYHARQRWQKIRPTCAYLVCEKV